MSDQDLKYSNLFENIDYNDSDNFASLTHYFQSKAALTKNIYLEDVQKIILNNPDIKKQLLNGKVRVGKDKNFKRNLRNLANSIEFDIPFPPEKNPKFKFIDLFAGIGGFRFALQSLNGKCVFSSEIDKYSKQVYEANFGEIPFGDIKNFTRTLGKNNEPTDEDLPSEDINQLIPDHDILAAGFPCQAFSIAGKRGGFEDTRGTLFYEIAKILKAKNPKAFILENVKGLLNHRGGATLNTILNVLEEDLNYTVPQPSILNAKDFGVPQNRERIIIVGFRNDLNINKDQFTYPKHNLSDSQFTTGNTFSDIKEPREVSVKYYLSDTYLETLREHKRRHKKKGNGFGYEIIDDDDIANAIVVGGMGRERNLVRDNRLTNFKPVTNIKGKVNREGVRRMTPVEWAKLQGLPENFKQTEIVSDTQAYKQLGNAVPVPVIEAVAKNILKLISYNVFRK